MTFLITQMLALLAAAVVLGGAIGWLLQRARSHVRINEIRNALAQRGRQLEQARADVALLNDDYDELRERTRDQIQALNAENRELPALTRNLEKSQLMVQQMIKRHEAQVRELTAEKTVLGDRLRTLQERVRARDGTAATGLPAAASSLPGGNAAVSINADDIDANDNEAFAIARAATDKATRESAPAPTDAASEQDVGTTASPDNPTTTRRGWASQPLPGSAGSATVVSGIVAADFNGSASADLGSDDDVSATVDDAEDLSARLQVDDTMDAVIEVDDELAAELCDDPPDLDGDATLSLELNTSEIADLETRPLFDPVERQDDLQQIFGIGPLTEKALNDLGITSYPQLATLERFEIEKIADALQIVPETIERDNWVGNARRQLEEVLDEL